MSQPSLTTPLSFRQAAEALEQQDKTGRGLKAMVLAREAQTSTTIATRLRGKKQPKMRVTLSALYEHLPELRPHRTPGQIKRNIRDYIEAIDERIAEVTAGKVQELVQPQIAELRKRIDSVGRDAETKNQEALELIEDLAKQLSALLGAAKRAG
ncbi:MAG TPA: hypothetical protein VJN18_32195 [Polyangiaceae bacterium]|nr:hypothetical protein [Polyangiaceae bacterium]